MLLLQDFTVFGGPRGSGRVWLELELLSRDTVGTRLSQGKDPDLHPSAGSRGQAITSHTDFCSKPVVEPLSTRPWIQGFPHRRCLSSGQGMTKLTSRDPHEAQMRKVEPGVGVAHAGDWQAEARSSFQAPCILWVGSLPPLIHQASCPSLQVPPLTCISLSSGTVAL